MKAITFTCAALAVSCSYDTSETRDAVLSQLTYDLTGMPTGVAPLVRDALGRATAINGAALHYGPDGALGTATHGTDTFDYITDEGGHRLAKKANGAFVEAYVDEGLVTATTVYMPVRMAGTTLGIVHDGRFESIATDARGTVLADAQGVTRAAAFGERTRVSTFARAVDYALSGRDTDLGTIRMGLRDYDPATHRFSTPDPLFLAHPDKCIEDPVECNLYSYAANRPADFVDPTGTDKSAITSIGIGPVNLELIVNHDNEWSVKLDLGIVPQGVALGVTGKAPAQSDIAVKVGVQANAQVGPWTLIGANLEDKYSLFGGESMELSARTIRSGVTVKLNHVDPHHPENMRIQAYGDIRGNAAFKSEAFAPTSESKLEFKAGPRAALSLTLNGNDAADAYHSIGQRISSFFDSITSTAIFRPNGRWNY